MVANGYLDTNIQKAFIRNIPGSTEQYCKILGAVIEAFKRHKSISIFMQQHASETQSPVYPMT